MDRFTVPARRGKAVRIAAGSLVEVTNTHGQQVADTWAFTAANLREHLSMDHTRSVNSNIFVGLASVLVTSERRPILTVVEDTSPGRHDTLLCPCNAAVYRELGCTEHHRSCTENLHEALAELGLEVPFTPASLNLFMNVPVREDGSVDRQPPRSRAGDRVVMKAELDQVLVFSACPQDITPINGIGREPTEFHVRVRSPGA